MLLREVLTDTQSIKSMLVGRSRITVHPMEHSDKQLKLSIVGGC